ncbi:hypothetical protein [Aquabacterium sp.]|uniref:hypothetical protein n=1 Tax=Aquabacterium sp. TaxID=1872578 RepID=UPI0040380887
MQLIVQNGQVDEAAAFAVNQFIQKGLDPLQSFDRSVRRHGQVECLCRLANADRQIGHRNLLERTNGIPVHGQTQDHHDDHTERQEAKPQRCEVATKPQHDANTV